jgi:hypothetical protein
VFWRVVWIKKERVLKTVNIFLGILEAVLEYKILFPGI